MVALATILAHVISLFLLRKAANVATLSASPWDDSLIQALRQPLLLVIWLIGLGVAAAIAGRETGAAIFDSVADIRNVGVVTCIAWFLVRLTNGVSQSFVALRQENGDEVDKTTIDALSKLARLTVIIIACLMAMQTLGFSVSGILAAGGIGGLAVGFAAKDLLANFFGGLTIYLDRPFSVGDWIRSPDRNIEGTVEYISWRHTRIRAFNKNPIYVPNAVFTTIVVENPSRMTHRRINETIGLRYDDIGAVKAIVSDVIAMLEGHEGIDKSQTLIVKFNAFGPSSLDFFIYTFTRTTEWVQYHEVKQDVLLQVAAIIDSHGAQIAFPTHTLHMQPERGPEPAPCA